MGDAFIVKRGGGGGKLYAAIYVTYPSGSVCTCTKGTKTWTAKGTSGSYIFYVPENGTYTVSCTDGTKTASKTVSITAQYQVENVTLSYRIDLIVNGQVASGIIFENHTANVEPNYNNLGYMRISTKDIDTPNGYYSTVIDFGEAGMAYTNLKFKAFRADSLNAYVNGGATYSATTIRQQLSSTETEYTLDISSLSGENYVSINATATHHGEGDFARGRACIYYMYLE